MIIRTVYEALPTYPATDQHPDAVRYFIDPYWVDAIGGEPSGAEVTAFLNPEIIPFTPTLVCLANLMIDEGDVQLVEAGATGLAFAFAVAPNVIWAYFTDEMPDSLYNPNVNSTSGSARITDRQTDHVEITIDAPTEPYTLFIQVFRTT